MSPMDLVIGMVFLTQTVVGVLGNFSLLYHYLFLHFTGCRLRTTDLILKHLIVANSLVLLSKGIPQTMAALGWEQFPNNFGCKLLYYLHRVGRGVSIGSTCLLSIFQAITISPRISRWAELKVKAPKYTCLCIALCWLLHMLVNVIFPVYVTGNWGNNTINKKIDYAYCSRIVDQKIADSLYAALLSFPDALCVGLMLWASGSMVSILHRHKQRVQHIHRTTLSPRSSPESRATQTILILVSTFVSFFTVSTILQVCLAVLDNPSWLLMNMATLFSACFPAVSPFVLLGRDPEASRISFSWKRNMKSPFSH